MRRRWVRKWSRKIEREQICDVSHNAKSSSSHCGVSVWISRWRCSIRQVQTSNSEGKRLIVVGFDWVDTQEVFTNATNLTRN